jgi:hypothetical protein
LRTQRRRRRRRRRRGRRRNCIIYKPFHQQPFVDASYLDTWMTLEVLIYPFHDSQHNGHFSISQNHKPTNQKEK